MTRLAHQFHTRHDFTPTLAWSAFQLLAGIEPEGVTTPTLADLARRTCSPLGARSDPSKVLASLADLGLAEAHDGGVRLTPLGRALAEGTGRTAVGFRTAIHALYAWSSLWERSGRATPSWSYRQVCRLLLNGPPGGLYADELVRSVVDAASKFHASRVSFSRSSVAGVANWLAEQLPPLAQAREQRVTRTMASPGPSAIRLHLGALCGLSDGRAILDGTALVLLAESLVTPPADLWPVLRAFFDESDEFLFVTGARPSVAFRGSADPFLRALIHPPTPVQP